MADWDYTMAESALQSGNYVLESICKNLREIHKRREKHEKSNAREYLVAANEVEQLGVNLVKIQTKLYEKTQL